MLGEPEVSIVAFASRDFDVYLLSDALTKRGWNLNSLQFPSRFVVCLHQPMFPRLGCGEGLG